MAVRIPPNGTTGMTFLAARARLFPDNGQNKNALLERARTGHYQRKCLLWGLVVYDGAFLEVEGFMVFVDHALSPVAVIVK